MTAAVRRSLVAVGRPCRRDLGHQRLTKPNSSQGCGSWLACVVHEMRKGDRVCCREGLNHSDAVDLDWSRTETVWESCVGRRCLDSPVQSRDLYHCCCFFKGFCEALKIGVQTK